MDLVLIFTSLELWADLNLELRSSLAGFDSMGSRSRVGTSGPDRDAKKHYSLSTGKNGNGVLGPFMTGLFWFFCLFFFIWSVYRAVHSVSILKYLVPVPVTGLEIWRFFLEG